MSALLEVPLPATGFRLWQSQKCVWCVEGPGNSCGGLFTSEEEARRFIRREARARRVAIEPAQSPGPQAGKVRAVEFRLPGVRFSAQPTPERVS